MLVISWLLLEKNLTFPPRKCDLKSNFFFFFLIPKQLLSQYSDICFQNQITLFLFIYILFWGFLQHKNKGRNLI